MTHTKKDKDLPLIDALRKHFVPGLFKAFGMLTGGQSIFSFVPKALGAIFQFLGNFTATILRFNTDAESHKTANTVQQFGDTLAKTCNSQYPVENFLDLCGIPFTPGRNAFDTLARLPEAFSKASSRLPEYNPKEMPPWVSKKP